MIMKAVTVILALGLGVSTAQAQDHLDDAIRGLAAKLTKDGISGRLADVVGSDAGVQAIQEKIEFLLSSRVARLERDASGCFEDHLFAPDVNGDLVLRPERRLEFEALRLRLPSALQAMTGFNHRADAIVRRLGETDEMDKLAKTAWADSGFRAAFFHRHPELRELDDAELLDAQGLRGIERQASGALRVVGPYAQEIRDRMAETLEHLESLKQYEKSYLKLVAALGDPAARATLSSDTAILFLLGRVLREANEGSQTPIGSLKEGDEDKKLEPAVSFNLDLAEHAESVRECEKMLTSLRALLEPALRDLAGGGMDEASLIEFLKNPRAQVLLAERMMASRDEQRGKADEIMHSTLEEDFTAEGERLVVKKGKYLGDDGKESPKALTDALNAVREEFAGSIREDFDRIAERCVDPVVIAVLENKPGTYLLMEFRDRILDRLIHAVHQEGFGVFVRAYLVKQGDSYSVRPDKTVRMEALLKRVEQIRKEQQQDK
ncbi:MAG TPA: hypothetical protein VKW04_11820 [Planctomycetota bacterium]|nr:hypothetical protein [Planctomycetota bacterium]